MKEDDLPDSVIKLQQTVLIASMKLMAEGANMSARGFAMIGSKERVDRNLAQGGICMSDTHSTVEFAC